MNTNRVTIPVETEQLSKIENVAFSSNLLKDVLTANKECESATLEISSKGLARIQFKVDDYDALYYLVAETND
jgi:ribosome maturation factor RimP